MFWIFITVVFAIIFWVGVGMFFAGKQTEEQQQRSNGDDFPTRGAGAALAVAAVVLWVLISGAMSIHNVGQREVAVVYNFSGTISGKKDAGTVMTMPYQHIRKENIGILHDEWTFSIGDQSSAVSKDQQQIGALLGLNYQINAEKVVDLYDRVGPGWKKIIIDARVPQVFKEVTAKYATADITANREQLRIDTRERLVQELAKYDIDVIDVFVKNLGFSDSYREAVERKQQQVQDALTAQAKVKQVEAEANQKVAAAEGAAKANIAEARGESTANKLRQRSLTPLLIQQQAIEKLNPKVTVIVCPPRTVCIPNTSVTPVETGN